MQAKTFFCRAGWVIPVLLFAFSCGDDNKLVLVVPKASLKSVSGLEMNSVTLHGVVDPNGFSTVAVFVYGTDNGYGDTVSADPGVITGNSNTAVYSKLTNISANTAYHYRLVTVNAVGVSFSPDSVFTTPGSVPAVSELICKEISTSSAVLSGYVNANGYSTSLTLDYGTSLEYGQTAAPQPSVVTGNHNAVFEIELTGLTSGAAYHCRLKAINEKGTVTGSDFTFSAAGSAPMVQTLSAEGIATDRATLAARVDPKLLQTSVAFEYGTTPEYGNTADFPQNPVSGDSRITVKTDISGLSPGTVYHYRVKAVNILGTSFGADSTFTSLGKLPTVITLAAGSPAADNAYIRAMVNPESLETNVAFEYGLTEEYGNSVSYSQNPVYGNTQKEIRIQLKGLNNWSTYHYRVVATNALGTAYGNDTSFRTLGTVSDIQGNVYQVAEIGTQTWMTENLKTKTLNDETPIPYVPDDNNWSLLTTPGYSVYNGSTGGNPYGMLYNWYAIQTEKICPTGWHIPTNEEWDTLAAFLGGENVAGGKLKETGYSLWISPNAGASNEYGFKGRPGGFRNKNGAYYYQSSFAYFWCSDEYDAQNGGYRRLAYNITSLYKGHSLKTDGLSVRCIKN